MGGGVEGALTMQERKMGDWKKGRQTVSVEYAGLETAGGGGG